MRIIAAIRQFLCWHRFDFFQRLPEMNGRAAIQYKCLFCGHVRQFNDARSGQ